MTEVGDLVEKTSFPIQNGFHTSGNYNLKELIFIPYLTGQGVGAEPVKVEGQAAGLKRQLNYENYLANGRRHKTTK